jgi:hypothetical protein
MRVCVSAAWGCAAAVDEAPEFVTGMGDLLKVSQGFASARCRTLTRQRRERGASASRLEERDAQAFARAGQIIRCWL